MYAAAELAFIMISFLPCGHWGMSAIIRFEDAHGITPRALRTLQADQANDDDDDCLAGVLTPVG
jgi:hypothetical protein